MNTKPRTRTLSGQYPDLALDNILQAFAMMLLGMLAITLHARLRTPLSMPGHHGLEFMAILLTGRMLSNIKYAGSFSALGTGLILLFPVFGFKDPFMGFNFMLPGIIIDTIFLSINKNRLFPLVLVLASALAYASIPLSRLILESFTGYVYPSLHKYGTPLYPVISHAFFGLLGGSAGMGFSLLLKRKGKSQ